MSLGPNDLEACPSRGARVRHAAHGRLCRICHADAEDFYHPDAHPARIEVALTGKPFGEAQSLLAQIESEARRLTVVDGGAA